MRILRPQPEPPSRPHAPAVPQAAGAGGPLLRCRVRLADGRVFRGELPASRHRAIQLGMLHAETAELVELTPGTRPLGGKTQLDRRRRPEHYLPGGAAGHDGWLQSLLEHAQRIVSGAYATQTFDGGPREEAFVGVAPRTQPRGGKDAIAHTRFLWVDVDEPGRLDLDELIRDLPDPTGHVTSARARVRVDHDDPYKRIAPAEYFERLAGIRVGRSRLVRCPAPWHADKHPSCSVGAEPGQGWCCHSGSCGARRSIYDLASVLQGGPYGRELRGEHFKRAAGDDSGASRPMQALT